MKKLYIMRSTWNVEGKHLYKFACLTDAYPVDRMLFEWTMVERGYEIVLDAFIKCGWTIRYLNYSGTNIWTLIEQYEKEISNQ